MNKRTILPVLLLSLILLVSGCTITVNPNGGQTSGGSSGQTTGGQSTNTQTTGGQTTDTTTQTSTYVSSVTVTSITDSENNVLYSGASTSDEIVRVRGTITATIGTTQYSTVVSHNGIEQFVSVGSTGAFETPVGIVPGQNTFQIIVRDLEGNIIGRSSQYIINSATVTNEAGQTVTAQTTDLRVTLTWNVDDTDVDLHVIDPNHCEAYYADKQAIENGALDVDITTGFGPEIYTQNQGTALLGDYEVLINYYSNHGNTEPVTATVRVQVNEGTVQTFTHTFTTDEGDAANWVVGNFRIPTANISPTNRCEESTITDNTNVSNTELVSVTNLAITSVGDQTSSGMSITTTNRVVTVTGQVSFTGTLNERVILYVNDVPQYVEVSSTGSFTAETVLAPGLNTLRISAVDSTGSEVFTSRSWTITASSIAASDLTVVLSWDTNYDDMDLHVLGPDGVETNYIYKNTSTGVLDIDKTDGYGPETFTLNPTAPNGVYEISTCYYANHGTGSSTDVSYTEDSHITVSITTNRETTTYRHTFPAVDAGTCWSAANITIAR
ncbi:Uncharacterised protein [Candidatus Tiddalikarchaeum anstoanum]|nr:Uncharacterised protein [Candidatus Tiddalikarchaeum anstoanum]